MNIRKFFETNFVTKKPKYGNRKRYTRRKLAGKIAITLTAGMAGVILAGTMPEQIQNFVEKRQEQTAITAWWGTLYPKFCFSRFPTENKDKKDDIKISFWLARVIDW